MKARTYDCVVLTVDVPVEFGEAIIPKGTTGAVVEAYDQPTEGYAVGVSIPDEHISDWAPVRQPDSLSDQFDVIPTDLNT